MPPRATAESLASTQREISVSEFFAKNRHLLGFDNPRKALLTAVKEAVDNALDACEEAGALPDLLVEITPAGGGSKPAEDATQANGKARKGGASSEERFRVVVQDNGPGIVRKQVENIFGKLLYGSKFHRLKMSRGQQGIGISAAGMYGLITTGKPVRIVSRTSKRKPAHEVVLKMDTSKNRADVVSDHERPEHNDLFPGGTGTRVEIELVGKYLKGARSVDEYLALTSIANPHARIVYRSPSSSGGHEETVFERSVDELPPIPDEIKPHPHGVELGTLIGMLERTSQTKLGGFFANEFCRVGPKVAKQVTSAAGLTPNSWVKSVDHGAAERLYGALQDARVMGPPTNCLSPIGVKTMLKGLEQGLRPEFITASSRPPAVYRGRPFIIEAGVAFGGNLPSEEQAKVYRFANRVPLQYQQSACASFKAVLNTAWRGYGLEQPRGSLPTGPVVFMIHMASVWVPFTSESKEAIADYDEIRAEMELALKDCGRKLRAFINRRKAMKRQGERRGVFTRYIGEIARACSEITGADQQKLYDALMATAESKTAEFDDVLDEEGKVVKDTDRLAKDEGVYIRPAAATPDADAHAGSARTERADDDDSPGGSNLFGEPDEPSPKPKPKRKKKTVKKIAKKVKKKRSSKAGK